MRWLALLALLWPGAASAQRISLAAVWDVPVDFDLTGVGVVGDGRVGVWDADGRLIVLDADLASQRSYSLGVEIAGIGRGQDGSIEVLTVFSRPLPMPSEGTARPLRLVGAPVDAAISAGSAIDSGWVALAEALPGTGSRVVALGADGVWRTIVEAAPQARLAALGAQFALTDSVYPMTNRVFDQEGRAVIEFHPRQSVLDSLTHGSLGIPESRWVSNPLLPFYDGGFLQPIRDDASGRTIMMTYTSDGVPVSWPVVRGATFDAFYFNPATGELLGVVVDDGARTVQKLRWIREN